VVAAWVACISLVTLFFHPFLGLAFLIASGTVLCGLVVAGRSVARAEPARLVGADLSPHDQPRVWASAIEVSRELGVPPLGRILVDGGTSVIVSGGRHHRYLVVGLALLIGLDTAELTSLVAREVADELSPDAATAPSRPALGPA
jgi:hypothetical protein